MLCSGCQHENPAGAKFCNACGAKLESACPTCGRVNPSGSRFCNECGTPLTGQSNVQRPASSVSPSQSPASYTPRHLAERILAEQAALEARGAIDGERKTVTLVFSDLKGSTALIEGL